MNGRRNIGIADPGSLHRARPGRKTTIYIYMEGKKMKEITVTIYEFSELSEKAQRRAWETCGIDYSDNYASEYCETLKKFEDIAVA